MIQSNRFNSVSFNPQQLNYRHSARNHSHLRYPLQAETLLTPSMISYSQIQNESNSKIQLQKIQNSFCSQQKGISQRHQEIQYFQIYQQRQQQPQRYCVSPEQSIRKQLYSPSPERSNSQSKLISQPFFQINSTNHFSFNQIKNQKHQMEIKTIQECKQNNECERKQDNTPSTASLTNTEILFEKNNVKNENEKQVETPLPVKDFNNQFKAIMQKLNCMEQNRSRNNDKKAITISKDVYFASSHQKQISKYVTIPKNEDHYRQSEGQELRDKNSNPNNTQFLKDYLIQSQERMQNIIQSMNENQNKQESIQKVKPIKISKTIPLKNLSSQHCKSSTQLNQNKQYGWLIFNPHASHSLLQKHIQYLKQCYTLALELQRCQAFYTELNLPDTNKSKTLILDLDETLIFASKVFDPSFKYQYCFNGEKIYFNIRPYTQQFLIELSKYYEIILFTTAEYNYAKTIASVIDPQQQWFSAILDRQYTARLSNGYVIKDLRIFSNRQRKNIVIVDNLVYSFANQISNGIPILEWNNDPHDKELNYLIYYLKELINEDIREKNQTFLKLEMLPQLAIQQQCPQFISQIYVNSPY